MRTDDLFSIPLNHDLQRLAQSFDCGGPLVFNSFLRDEKALDPAFGKTFVLLTEDVRSIIGYYNICAGEMVMCNEYGALRCGGAVYINYLAVDKRYRGRVAVAGGAGSAELRWSDILLGDCLDRISRIRDECIGFSFVTLSSTKDGFDLYRNRFKFELIDEADDISFYDPDKDSSGGIKMYLPLDYEDI